MLPEVGFGVPSLASFLPIPAGPGLVAIQSQVDLAGPQRFCLARTSDQGVPWHRFLMFFGWCYDVLCWGFKHQVFGAKVLGYAVLNMCFFGLCLINMFYFNHQVLSTDLVDINAMYAFLVQLFGALQGPNARFHWP
jgi:hypothetical protein